MKPRSIEVRGRRWFNWFNTAEVVVDENFVYITPKQYGYDYEQAARSWLKELGYLPGIEECADGVGETLEAYCKRTGCRFSNSVEDVQREQDLHSPVDAVQTHRVLEDHARRYRGRTRQTTEPHVQCERAGRCLEHDLDPGVEACR